ncbi:MAG: hypothetical protein IPN15_22655 [Saprospiraceae bacterium]|nr:hypothetical protein [Candidatus Vicinibacter affinis]
MRIKFNHIAVLSILLFTNFQCDEDNLCDPVINIAALNVDLSPEKKEYLIGDTILLKTDFSTLLTLTNSNEKLMIDSGMCNLGLFVLKLGMQPDSLVGFSDFDIVNIIGELNQDLIWDQIEKRYKGIVNFNCNDDKCEFKIGLIPKVKGSYCFALYIGSIMIQDTTLCPSLNKLNDNKFNVNSYNREIFKELDIHYPILLPTFTGGGYWDIIDNDGAFAFKVK